jgi:hypothetical protein
MNGGTAIRCAIMALVCVFVYAEEVGQDNSSSIPREGGQVNSSRCRNYFEHVSSFCHIVLTVVLCHCRVRAELREIAGNWGISSAGSGMGRSVLCPHFGILSI